MFNLFKKKFKKTYLYRQCPKCFGTRVCGDIEIKMLEDLGDKYRVEIQQDFMCRDCHTLWNDRPYETIRKKYQERQQ